MKKIWIKRVIVAMLSVMMLLSLTGCATKLNGTYTNHGLVDSSITFYKDGTVDFSIFGLSATGGHYEIKDGTMTITYNVLGLETSQDYQYSKKGNSIFLNGEEFVKE